jgi:AcrR family transcriptional regulator
MGKGEQTKAEIIRQAAVLFNQRGYAGAAISDVMEATGLEKGGIYRHFSSKDELALEAFDYAVRLVNGRYLEAIRSSRNALERLGAVVDMFTELEQDVPIGGGCPIMNTAVDSDDTHPALRERSRAALQSWHDMLTSVVARGIRRGELRPDAEPAAVATNLIALLEGGLMMSRLTGDRDHIDRCIEAIHAWIQGLQPLWQEARG